MYNSCGTALDGIIYDFYGMARQYFQVLPEEPTTLDLLELFTADERNQYYQFSKSPYIVKELIPYPGAIDFLTWLASQFKSLYVVTSRFISTEAATKKQVASWNIQVKDVILEQNKQKVVPDLVSIFFEDSPKQLDALKTFKYLKLLVPIRSYTKRWIQDNISEYSVFPYSSFDEAKEIVLHLQELDIQ
jgi:hypothetical protein